MMLNLPMSANILVAGCGAIGGIYAAHLATVANVTAYDTNPAHVEAINRDGLKISGRTETHARIEALGAAEQLEGRRFDAVIIAVKSLYTAELLRSLLPRLAGHPLMYTLQNGQGNVELLLAECDWDVAQGMTWEAGEYHGPGQIRHLIHGSVSWMGPARGSLEGAGRLAELMDLAGLPTRATADPRGAIWSKFIFNCAMNPVSALLRGIPEAKYQSEEVYELLRDMVAEGLHVAQRLGITPLFHPLQMIEDVRAGKIPLPRHPGSMAQDMERGAPIEIDALTGYMIRKAAEVGVPVPMHEAVYRLMKGLEFGTRTVRERADLNNAVPG